MTFHSNFGHRNKWQQFVLIEYFHWSLLAVHENCFCLMGPWMWIRSMYIELKVLFDPSQSHLPTPLLTLLRYIKQIPFQPVALCVSTNARLPAWQVGDSLIVVSITVCLNNCARNAGFGQNFWRWKQNLYGLKTTRTLESLILFGDVSVSFQIKLSFGSAAAL